MAAKTDIDVRNEGSIFMFTPLTAKGRAWVDEHLELESWQWLGGGFSVEHRYAGDLAEAMQNDGLIVK